MERAHERPVEEVAGADRLEQLGFEAGLLDVQIQVNLECGALGEEGDRLVQGGAVGRDLATGMGDKKLAAGLEHVELDHVDVRSERRLQGGERVVGGERRRAAVGDLPVAAPGWCPAHPGGAVGSWSLSSSPPWPT